MDPSPLSPELQVKNITSNQVIVEAPYFWRQEIKVARAT